MATWGVVLAVIGYSPEATTPGTGLLLARDTGGLSAKRSLRKGDYGPCQTSLFHLEYLP